jgi:hypothetical protein
MNVYCERRGAGGGAVWPLHLAFDILLQGGGRLELQMDIHCDVLGSVGGSLASTACI